MWRRVTIGAGVLLAISVVAFVVSILWRSFGGDYDKYGRVDIPGSATVTLPQGEVDVIYAVRLPNNGGGGALTVPRLGLDIEPPAGATDPAVDEDIGGTVTVNSASHVRVWKMHVLQAGDYQVTTEGDVGGFIEPQLTFGTGTRLGSWPIVASVALFFVSLGLFLVGGLAGGTRSRTGSSPAHPAALPPYGPTPPTTPMSPTASQSSPTATTLPSTRTPEQELARLAQLQQLTDLHASGTLSDAEYDAARSRLGG